MSNSFVTPWPIAHQAPLSKELWARILEWVAIPFSRVSSWPRDQIWVSCIAGRFFTNWATREAQATLVQFLGRDLRSHFMPLLTAASLRSNSPLDLLCLFCCLISFFFWHLLHWDCTSQGNINECRKLMNINEKTLAPWKKSYAQPREHIKKQRHYFANKGTSSQSYGFSSGHVWMWELDFIIKKAEHRRIDAFELWCWRRLLRVP